MQAMQTTNLHPHKPFYSWLSTIKSIQNAVTLSTDVDFEFIQILLLYTYFVDESTLGCLVSTSLGFLNDKKNAPNNFRLIRHRSDNWCLDDGDKPHIRVWGFDKEDGDGKKLCQRPEKSACHCGVIFFVSSHWI